MAEQYIIVDLGASNGRVIAANVAGGTFTFDVVYRFAHEPVFLNDGELCWDLPRIFHEIKQGLKLALGKYPNARSVGIDTFGCDFGFLDAQGRLLGYPLCYRDSAQHEAAAQLHALLSEQELFSLSQGPCNRIMGIYKLFQLMKNNRLEYREAKHLLMLPDLLNYLLTGRISNEFTNATMTLLVNQYTRDWEPEIPERLGLRRDILGPITEPGTVLGPLRDTVCRELDVPPIPVVVCATHDTASAVAGVPVTRPDKNWGFVSLGTWALAGIERPEPLVSPELVDLEFGNEGGVMGRSMLLKNINGLWVIQQCRSAWSFGQGGELSWNEISARAAEASEMESLFICDDPRFQAVQSDMPAVVRDYCRETGQPVPEGLGEIACCVYRSLACRIAYCFGRALDVIGEKLDCLHVLGGGTKNAMLCQWIANAMGIPVIAGPTETTAVGNLIFQMLADGRIGSLSEGRAMCAASNDLLFYEPAEQAQWKGIMDRYRALVEG